MIDTLIKLVEKFAELERRRESQRADFFKNFVEPVWKDFEAVHTDYLGSFRKYCDLVSTSDGSFDHQHPIFRQVESDSMLSDSMRARVAHARQLARGDDRLDSLVSAIMSYLEATPHADNASGPVHLASRDPSWPAPMCLPRIYLKQELRAVASRDLHEDDKRKLAVMCVTTVALCMQQQYDHVFRSFLELKSGLLAPR